VVKADEISTAKRQSQALHEELSLVKESYSELNEQFQKLKEDMDGIRSGKGFMKLLLNVAKQQQEMSEVLRRVSGKKFDVVLPSGLED